MRTEETRYRTVRTLSLRHAAQTSRARFARSILLLIVLLAAGTSAMATINSISSDWCQTCLPGATHRIVAGKQTSMLVKGRFVDLATRAEISGSGVSVSLGQRVGGSNSSIVVRFNVDANAALGDRTVKLRYAIETNGPDTFRVQVVRGGRIDSIQQRIPGLQPGTTRLVSANQIALNQRVTLVFSGTRLGNASVAPSTSFRNAQVLPGATETHCEVALEFTRAGTINVNLLDAAVGPQPGNLLFKFFYGGLNTVTVNGSSASQPAPQPPISHIPSGGTASPTTFVDVAPRANVLNLFRTSGGVVSINGSNFLRVDDRWCTENGVVAPSRGSTAKPITLPDLIWGVSNVGTAVVPVAFTSQLSANNIVLQTQTIAVGSLPPGATQEFHFQRQRNQVTVIRFAPPQQAGCFVNPHDPSFFQDPPFVVKVDIGNVVPESATNRFNNTRTY
jgi:hypothetical protein